VLRFVGLQFAPAESLNRYYNCRGGCSGALAVVAMVDRLRDPFDEGPEESHRFTTCLALAIVLVCVGHFVVLHMLKKHHRPIGTVQGFLALLAVDRQRRSATIAQIASTSPNGHAPCRKPYAEPSAHDPANASTNQWLRSSSA
jgi:hypothetical protein